MTVKGHLLLAYPLATTILTLTEQNYFGHRMSDNVTFMSLFYLGIFIGTIFPDIDEPESYIGRKLPVISHILSIFIEHRGITHYLLIPLLILTFNFLYVEEQSTKIVIYAFAIGNICHDVGDLLTKGGIRGFFFPLMPTTTIGLLPKFLRFRTNSLVEYIFMIFLIGLNVYGINFLIHKNFFHF